MNIKGSNNKSKWRIYLLMGIIKFPLSTLYKHNIYVVQLEYSLRGNVNVFYTKSWI